MERDGSTLERRAETTTTIGGNAERNRVCGLVLDLEAQHKEGHARSKDHVQNIATVITKLAFNLQR